MANRALLHQLATAVLANFKQLVKDKPVRNSSDRQPARRSGRAEDEGAVGAGGGGTQTP